MKLEVFNQYVDKVCALFTVDKKDVFSNKKDRALVDARHLLFFLCHRRPIPTSYVREWVKAEGGNISHSSIIHGIKVMERKVKEDKDIESVLKEIESVVYI